MVSESEQFHFLVFGSDVNGVENFYLDWYASTPQEALELTLRIIPSSWSGGIEVLDEETLETCDMPLVDYWKDQGDSQIRQK